MRGEWRGELRGDGERMERGIERGWREDGEGSEGGRGREGIMEWMIPFGVSAR